MFMKIILLIVGFIVLSWSFLVACVFIAAHGINEGNENWNEHIEKLLNR